MPSPLPFSVLDVLDWPWDNYAPYYDELAARPLDADGLDQWMRDWSQLKFLIAEAYNRLYVATTLDTADEAAQKRYHTFLEEIFPPSEAADQMLKERLLDSSLEPENFSVQLRAMRAEAELFREANLPLLSQEQILGTDYDKIVGAQTIEWEGKELTLPQLNPIYQDQDRDKRERAWRLAMSRWLQDRDAINELWGRFMDLRRKLAENADRPDYRAFRWVEMGRFDYSPDDCKSFDEAIAQVVVPAASRIYQKRRERLGLDSLRPWDLDVDPRNNPPLRPFKDDAEFQSKGAAILNHVDPELGAHFEAMQRENLLDLENRKGKAPGGYCIDFPVAKRPFIFMNAVGIHDDVQTLLHESGHAFHVFETAALPYAQHYSYGAEIAEVASMSMELLSAPYLTADRGGYYTEQEAARARIEHLESSIRFWPYMAVVDSFQHWLYENHAAATDPANCDAKWAELWDRYMQGIDYSDLDDVKETGWHRKLHIHQIPFYYVDYGLAQLGAVQVWANAKKDQAGAVKQYRHALSLGATKTLPELFAAAGAKLSFDAGTLGEAIDLMESTIEELEQV